MSKLHIKKGDTVYVNAGEDKGKTGRVLKVLVKEGRALLKVSTWCLRALSRMQRTRRWYCEARSFYPLVKLEPR